MTLKRSNQGTHQASSIWNVVSVLYSSLDNITKCLLQISEAQTKEKLHNFLVIYQYIKKLGIVLSMLDTS